MAITAVVYLRITGIRFAQKDCAVADHRDRLLADRVRGPRVNAAIAEINNRLRPEQTLAVLSEGVMLNYITRRVNPTPYHNFMPDGLIIFGEDNILRSFQEHPPDFVMLVHKDTAEFGYQFFGRDYGTSIDQWIQSHYEEVWLIGNRPFQRAEEFGMLLLQRRGEGP